MSFSMATQGLLHSSFPCHESSWIISLHAGLHPIRSLDGKNVSQHANMPGTLWAPREYKLNGILYILKKYIDKESGRSIPKWYPWCKCVPQFSVSFNMCVFGRVYSFGIGVGLYQSFFLVSVSLGFKAFFRLEDLWKLLWFSTYFPYLWFSPKQLSHTYSLLSPLSYKHRRPWRVSRRGTWTDTV